MSRQTLFQSSEDVEKQSNPRTETKLEEYAAEMDVQAEDNEASGHSVEATEGGGERGEAEDEWKEGIEEYVEISSDEQSREDFGEGDVTKSVEQPQKDEREKPPQKKIICRTVRRKRKKREEASEGEEEGEVEKKEEDEKDEAESVIAGVAEYVVEVENEEEGGGTERMDEESEGESTETEECVSEDEEEEKPAWDDMAEDEFGFLLLTDPGIYEALELREQEPSFSKDGVDAYLEMCKAFGNTPIKSLLNQLLTDTSDLKFYGASPKNIRALAIVIKYNPHVQKLILSDTPLEDAAVYEIAELIRENITLDTILLDGCRIGARGAELLAETLALSQTLKHLDLAYNQLGDDGVVALAPAIAANTSIEILDLSRNEIGMRGIKALAQALKAEQNTTLRDLRLSWNRLFEEPDKGLKPFLAQLRTEEQGIQRLDLAWNALGETSAPLLGTFMAKAPNLRQLFIDHNRFPDAAVVNISRGLAKAPQLEVLHAGFNPMTSAAAYSLITAATEHLKVLNLDGITVKKDFLNVKAKKEGMTVLHGEPLSVYTISPPDMAKIMLDRARFEGLKPKKKKRKKDFGHLLLELEKDGIETISADEFFQRVTAKKIKMRDELIRGLAEQFQNKKKKKVDLKEMLNKYMSLYPDTVLPPPKTKNEKKAKRKRKEKETTKIKK